MRSEYEYNIYAANAAEKVMIGRKWTEPPKVRRPDPSLFQRICRAVWGWL